MKIITKSFEQTLKCGFMFAKLIPKHSIISLTGEIGTGKTTFIKGIGSFLGLKADEIISPYFNILFQYNKKSKTILYHFDFMRLNSINDLYELNIEEIFESDGMVVMEWADKFKKIIPEKAININITDISINERIIEIKSSDNEIMERLKPLFEFND